MARKQGAASAQRPGEDSSTPLTTSVTYLKLVESEALARQILKTLDKCEGQIKKIRKEVETILAEEVADRLEGKRREIYDDVADRRWSKD